MRRFFYWCVVGFAALCLLAALVWVLSPVWSPDSLPNAPSEDGGLKAGEFRLALVALGALVTLIVGEVHRWSQRHEEQLKENRQQDQSHFNDSTAGPLRNLASDIRKTLSELEVILREEHDWVEHAKKIKVSQNKEVRPLVSRLDTLVSAASMTGDSMDDEWLTIRDDFEDRVLNIFNVIYAAKGDQKAMTDARQRVREVGIDLERSLNAKIRKTLKDLGAQ